MRLLFIGDVVGKAGCTFLSNNLYKIKKEHNIDITVVNGENSAAGNGITKHSMDFLTRCGADVITTGNHAFKRRECSEIFDTTPHLLRPANYPDDVIGKGYYILDVGMTQIAVINLMGVVYMEPLNNPFDTIDNILSNIDTPNIFVDFHAEATAEKKAMGHYLAGRVTAMFGTHTHVQTNDATILKNHTGYITDAGMTGPEDSILGITSEVAIEKLRKHYPVRFTESSNPCFINGVVTDFDKNIGKINKIYPIIYR